MKFRLLLKILTASFVFSLFTPSAFASHPSKCENLFSDENTDPLSVKFTREEAKRALVELVDEASYLYANTTKTFPQLERLAKEHEQFDEAYELNPSITKFEAIALWFYTVDAYRYLNQPLRLGMPLDRRVAIFGSLVRSALRKCPPHKGTLTRFQRIPRNLFLKMKPGKTVLFKSFLSTSAKKDFDQSALFHLQGAESDTYMLILNAKRNAYDIHSASEVPAEKEVLFDAGSYFRITKVSGKKIYLEELEVGSYTEVITDKTKPDEILKTDGIDREKVKGNDRDSM